MLHLLEELDPEHDPHAGPLCWWHNISWSHRGISTRFVETRQHASEVPCAVRSARSNGPKIKTGSPRHHSFHSLRCQSGTAPSAHGSVTQPSEFRSCFLSLRRKGEPPWAVSSVRWNRLQLRHCPWPLSRPGLLSRSDPHGYSRQHRSFQPA